MKYNYRKIMKMAWSNKVEYGCDMSLALRMAWAAAKTGMIREKLESENHMDLMSDMHGTWDEATRRIDADTDYINAKNAYCNLLGEAWKIKHPRHDYELHIPGGIVLYDDEAKAYLAKERVYSYDIR